MPTTDSTNRDTHDFLTGANTGVRYNGMSSAGADTHEQPTGPQSPTGIPVAGGQGVSLPDIDAPIWQRILTGAIVVEGVEFAGMLVGEALTRRLTFLIAVLSAVAALAYAYGVGVPAIMQPQYAYTEATFALAGFALPYALLGTVYAGCTILTTLLTAALTLTLNLLRMAVGLAAVAAIGYAVYYILTQA
ncbi:hypothetical protein DZD18_02465 [Rhodobacteraceae bacterium W635]|uniref:hypothetical protein n=1 Tax=Nioella halotolerans TaxID=2303578 RepID=UPI000E87A825|nr:hypothetical protein DZD18_02465 [Rhodobacteraceae bacterium W635]